MTYSPTDGLRHAAARPLFSPRPLVRGPTPPPLPLNSVSGPSPDRLDPALPVLVGPGQPADGDPCAASSLGAAHRRARAARRNLAAEDGLLPEKVDLHWDVHAILPPPASKQRRVILEVLLEGQSDSGGCRPSSIYGQATPMPKQHWASVPSVFAPRILAVHCAIGHRQPLPYPGR